MELSKFGVIKVWSYKSLEFLKFGVIKVWSYKSLEFLKFGSHLEIKTVASNKKFSEMGIAKTMEERKRVIPLQQKT